MDGRRQEKNPPGCADGATISLAAGSPRARASTANSLITSVAEAFRQFTDSLAKHVSTNTVCACTALIYAFNQAQAIPRCQSLLKPLAETTG
jgi:hypothetical protein